MFFISINTLKGIYLFNNPLDCEIIIHIFKSKDPNQQLKLELYYNFLSKFQFVDEKGLLFSFRIISI
jgi:hypothetical protein